MEVYNFDLTNEVTSFNGNSNPVSGSRVITTPGLYFSHQLFDDNRPSTDAVPYHIIVTNNRVYMCEYSSVLMMRQFNRSAHLIEVDGGCDLVITYDGRGVRPGDKIFLFTPDQTDLTDDSLAFSFNLTASDPKSLSVTLNMPGKWKFVIDHGQNNLTLDDYEVYVDTSPTSTCINACSSIPNSVGKAPNFDGTLICNCESQYFWSVLEQRCKLASDILFTEPVQSVQCGNIVTTCDCLDYYEWDAAT